MSKGNMLLGHARGKVGDLVFSRSNGQQITRSRAAVVKNPQTESQMITRIILNTVAQAYSRMSEITDHSFEGVQVGQRSMSYFMSKNISALRTRVAEEVAAGGDLYNVHAFTPIGENGYSPNVYVISKGTLPEVATYAKNWGRPTHNFALSANTYQAFLDDYGLQRGDQITFCVTQGTTPANNKFYFARVILDPMDANGDQLPMSTAFIVDGAVNMPNTRNEQVVTHLSYADGEVTFGFSAQLLTGSAIIVSRKSSDGSWLRSNASMAVDEFSAFNWPSMGDCLDMLKEGDVQTLSSRYLNNAGTGQLASANASTAATPFVLADGSTFYAVGLGEANVGEQSYIVMVDAEGKQVFIMGAAMKTGTYGKYLSSATGTIETAWANIATASQPDAAHTHNLGADGENIKWSDVEWFVSKGVSPDVFFTV